MKSLRARLILLLCLGLGLVWALAAWWGHLAARHEVDELFDAQLAQAAQALISTAQHEIHERDEHGDEEGRDISLPTFHEYEQRILFQIWDKNGKLLLRSSGAPSSMMGASRKGYAIVSMQGENWRVLTRYEHHAGFMVQVAEPLGMREWLARHIALKMLWPMLLVAPVFMLLIWWFVGRGLQPLRDISREVESRAANRLDAIKMDDVPDEVAPLAVALNALFAKLTQAFESERRFTADAAHELRTPLAALKVQAQVALRATDDNERKDALDKVLQGVDRATRLITQLLTLARVDPDSVAATHQPFSLFDLASACIEELRPMAQARQIALDLQGHAANVRGDAGQIAVLLRNLVDNALRYTPKGGSVEVAIRSGDGVTLEVADSGSGIPQEQRERVLERFYRIPGNMEPGSGLGLSIVKRIAEIHGAKIALDSSVSGGLLVRVKFPHG